MSNTINPNTQSVAASLFGTSKTGTSGSATKVKSDPVAEFLAYQKQTPQEKMVDSILKKYGLTKEDLGNLPPDKLKQIQDEIKATILSQTKQQMAEKGILIDLSA